MHVAITGASSGIGTALAREMAGQEGISLTLVARRGKLLRELAKELAVPCHVATADLSEVESCTRWIEPAERELGPIDTLINNAGVMFLKRFAECDPEEGEHLLRVNLLAPLRTVRAVVPRMIERGAGTIVNVASVAAFAPLPGTEHYAASKAGLAAASELLRSDLAGSGVRVVTVYPGPIDTDMSKAAHDAMEESFLSRQVADASPEELARRIRRAVKRGDARVIYPATYGVARYLPDAARFLIDRLSPPLRD